MPCAKAMSWPLWAPAPDEAEDDEVAEPWWLLLVLPLPLSLPQAARTRAAVTVAATRTVRRVRDVRVLRMLELLLCVQRFGRCGKGDLDVPRGV